MSMSLKPLNEQVIVITGASSGIGLATAQRAAKRGAKVVLAARNGEALAMCERNIREAGGEAVHCVVDVSKREDLDRLAAEAIRAFGGFDTWINNAGLSIFGRLADISEADNRRLFDVNFWGVVHGSAIAADHLRTKGGAIINLGSIASDMAIPIQGMYSASKHAIKGFTDALRMELEADGAPISVTLIKPASINTPFPDHARNYLDRAPKLPAPVYAPEDVADAILYAAERGGRDYYIGGGGKVMSQITKHAPRAADWMGAQVMARQQTTEAPATEQEGTLFAPGQDGDIHGHSPHRVMRSAYTRATLHPLLTGALVAGAGLTGLTAAFFSRNGRTQ